MAKEQHICHRERVLHVRVNVGVALSGIVENGWLWLCDGAAWLGVLAEQLANNRPLTATFCTPPASMRINFLPIA